MEIDKFKAFIRTIPSVKDDVINGRYSWQQLYEFYVLYGESDKMWDAYKKNNFDINSMFEIIKNIDLNALSKSFDGLQKVLDLLAGFNQNDLNKKSKQWYDD